MLSLTTSTTCGDNDQLCDYVRRLTHSDWLATAANWLIAKPFAIAVIVILGLVARWVVNKLITRLVSRAPGARPLPVPGLLDRRAPHDPEAEKHAALTAERRRQRAETMGSVLRSIASFAIFSVVSIMVISELGYNVAPLIASAGLVGVALGFGAQSLVKDFLSGIFMFFEDQFGVGDTVVIGDTTGVVEALALRVTRLRSEDGTTWYVRNGEILKVGNVSQQQEANLSEQLSTPADKETNDDARQLE
ncbi:MAG: moderate conductance mechanosensitive channel [Nocardioidaceae bacterium]|jgi:small conductance mechanosensitive channel|nr:moderate conductance mechanosensitive channel [Nocardioidaceae bacterium]